MTENRMKNDITTTLKGVKMTYTNGATCPDSGEAYKFSLNMYCDEDMGMEEYDFSTGVLGNLCEPYIDRNDESLHLEGDFKPSLKNSVCFIYQWWNHVTVIFVNYYGRPFTQDIMECKKLRMAMFGMYACALAIIFEYIPELNEGFELVPFPNEEFKNKIAYSLGLDFVLCYGIEKLCKTIYL